MSILYSILIADFITVFVITIPWFRTFTWHRYNPPFIKKIMLYGAPLMVVEFMQIAHAFIDRFLINYFMGAEHVALYSAPYSIAEIISAILLGSVSTALVPIYMGIWNSGEKERTAEFLSTVSDYFLLFFPVFIMGSYIVSGPVMNILATDKYADRAYILPIALTGLLVFSSTFIYSAGLKFKKSQNKVMQYVFESLILNVFLNIVFIEPFGIVASAWSTVVSYLWMSIRYYYASKEILKIHINIGYLFRGLLIAMIVYLCIYLLGFDENAIIDLLVNLFSSVIIGLLLFYLLDGAIQKKVNELFSSSFR